MTANGAGRILIVDDDAETRWLLTQACETVNYAVEEAATGSEALAKLTAAPFDVMLLDLQLPDMNGVQALDEIAAKHPDLITIVLTANATRDSAIAAIKTGVADYLSKPLSLKQVLEAIASELAQRALRQRRLIELGIIGDEIVGAAGDRERAGDGVQGDQWGGSDRRNPGVKQRVRLDPKKQEARVVGRDSEPIMLTKGETELLAAMLRKSGDVMSYQELAYEAWGERLETDHAASIIRPLIFRLRRKLEPEPSMPRWIRTVRGVGYIFNPR